MFRGKHRQSEPSKELEVDVPSSFIFSSLPSSAHTALTLDAKQYTVKTFGLLQPLFQLPQLHVCGVCIMKFKECFQSSENLEINTLRSFFFNNQSSFQKTNQLPFVEKAWLHIVMVEMPVMYM